TGRSIASQPALSGSLTGLIISDATRSRKPSSCRLSSIAHRRSNHPYAHQDNTRNQRNKQRILYQRDSTLFSLIHKKPSA
ncbi:MAG: hypothetical protein ACK56I_29295, partial [bacterium]